MIDWGKYWLRDAALIQRIRANPDIEFKGNYSHNTGEVMIYPLFGKWDVWEFEIKTPTWLEITGSLHKYWNKGTNENDFTYNDLFVSIVNFCNFIQVSPYDLTVHNLEFGVNIRPLINASEILREIICFKNVTPKKAIDNEKGFFLVFEMGEYYYKLYDKGKQFNTINTLRAEIKAVNSGFLKFANIVTMADLLCSENLILLGRKTDNFFNEVVFDDSTIDPDYLSVFDRKVYQVLSNARNWSKNKKNKTTTIRAKEIRFRAIVGKYGTKNLSSVISDLINDKWNELLRTDSETLKNVETFLECNKNDFCRFSPLIYTGNSDKVPVPRYCLICGRDISNQNPNSKYCSANFVGEQQAHKCRNANSNPRNNFKNGIKKIMAKGQTLFDINPYLRSVT